jgi:hypothetical protein
MQEVKCGLSIPILTALKSKKGIKREEMRGG